MPQFTKAYDDALTGFLFLRDSGLRRSNAHIYYSIVSALYAEAEGWVRSEAIVPRIDEYLKQLSTRGVSDLPTDDGELKTGGAILNDLVRTYRWLEREIDASGRTVYRPTSLFLDARAAIVAMSRNDDTTLTGSSMRLVLSEAGRVAAELTGDRDTQIDYLRNQRERIDEEINALLEGTAEARVDPYRISDDLRQLRRMTADYPRDARRVADYIDVNVAQLTSDFYTTDMPQGQAIQGYLDGFRRIDESEAGRRYRDAVALCQDYEHDDLLRATLKTIADSPVLGAEEHAVAVQTLEEWRNFDHAMREVDNARSRGWRLIHRNVTRYESDAGAARTQALKDLTTTLVQVIALAGPRATLPVANPTGRWQGRRVVNRPPQSKTDLVPEPIVRHEAQSEPIPEDVMRSGTRIADALRALYALAPKDPQAPVNVPELFPSMPKDVSSAAEMVAMHQATAELGVAAQPYEVWECSQDGTPTYWSAPGIVLTTSQLEALILMTETA